MYIFTKATCSIDSFCTVVLHEQTLYWREFESISQSGCADHVNLEVETNKQHILYVLNAHTSVFTVSVYTGSSVGTLLWMQP